MNTLPSTNYVHNGSLYSLSVRSVKPIARFSLSEASGDKPDEIITSVFEVKIRSERLDRESRQEFTIWTTSEGPFKGIPLRIRYRPRWWLRLDLELNQESTSQKSGIQEDCR